MAATKMKRAELLENLCSARRFPTLVVQMNTDKSKSLLIRVNPCPSVAELVIEKLGSVSILAGSKTVGRPQEFGVSTQHAGRPR